MDFTVTMVNHNIRPTAEVIKSYSLGSEHFGGTSVQHSETTLSMNRKRHVFQLEHVEGSHTIQLQLTLDNRNHEGVYLEGVVTNSEPDVTQCTFKIEKQNPSPSDLTTLFKTTHEIQEIFAYHGFTEVQAYLALLHQTEENFNVSYEELLFDPTLLISIFDTIQTNLGNPSTESVFNLEVTADSIPPLTDTTGCCPLSEYDISLIDSLVEHNTRALEQSLLEHQIVDHEVVEQKLMPGWKDSTFNLAEITPITETESEVLLASNKNAPYLCIIRLYQTLESESEASITAISFVASQKDDLEHIPIQVSFPPFQVDLEMVMEEPETIFTLLRSFHSTNLDRSLSPQERVQQLQAALNHAIHPDP